MDTRKLSSEYRMRRWAEIIKECNASGLSIKAYCENAGFHENTFFYWRKKLREALINGMDDTGAATKGIISANYNEAAPRHAGLIETVNQPPTGWVSVGMNNRNETDSPKHTAISIHRGGWTIAVETGIDAALLTETLKAVAQTCC